MRGVNRGRASLLEMNPDATWDDKPTEYRLSGITRVNFGGDYENALHIVGGDPAAGLPHAAVDRGRVEIRLRFVRSGQPRRQRFRNVFSAQSPPTCVGNALTRQVASCVGTMWFCTA